MTDDTTPEDEGPSPLLVAFGAYTDALRDHAGLSYERVAAELGVGLQSIFRIDKAKVEGKILVVLEYLGKIGGTFSDLEYLASLPSPTKADGQARAARRIRRLKLVNRSEQLREHLPALLDRIAEAAADDPDLIARLDGYLDALTARGPAKS
jgi:DNA-binding XRE family transcriptional regulator